MSEYIFDDINDKFWWQGIMWNIHPCSSLLNHINLKRRARLYCWKSAVIWRKSAVILPEECGLLRGWLSPRNQCSSISVGDNRKNSVWWRLIVNLLTYLKQTKWDIKKDLWDICLRDKWVNMSQLSWVAFVSSGDVKMLCQVEKAISEPSV